MSDSRVFRFTDYYDAWQFAQQLEDEGHRAEVHEFIYGMAPLAIFEVRVVAYQGGLEGDPEESEGGSRFGEFEQGAVGRWIDEALRLVTASAMCLTLPLGIYVAAKTRWRLPPPSLELFGITVLAAAMLFAGGYFSVAVYRDYRADEDWAVLVMQLVGWVMLLVFANIAGVYVF